MEEAWSSNSTRQKIVFQDPAIIETSEDKAKCRKIAADIVHLQKLAKATEELKAKKEEEFKKRQRNCKTCKKLNRKFGARQKNKCARTKKKLMLKRG